MTQTMGSSQQASQSLSLSATLTFEDQEVADVFRADASRFSHSLDPEKIIYNVHEWEKDDDPPEI